jgi:hypothetical protein
MFNLSIRRALVISGLFVGAATLLATPTKVMADTTDTVPLSATVDSTLNIVATPLTAAGDLPMAAQVQTVDVATLAIDTNNKQGYTLKMESLNGEGKLKNASGSTSISYQVGAAQLGASETPTFAAPGTNNTYQTSDSNANGTNPVTLSIKYTPAALQDPGTYADTINLTVTDR